MTEDKKRKNRLFVALWLVGIFVTSALTYYGLLNKEHFESGFLGHRSIGLNCVIAGTFVIFFFVVSKQMTTLWLQVSSRTNVFAHIYDRLLIPIMSFLYPAGWDNLVIENSPANVGPSFFFVVLALLLLADPANLIRHYLISNQMPVRAGNFIFVRHPADFWDIFPFFLIIHGVFLSYIFFSWVQKTQKPGRYIFPSHVTEYVVKEE